MASSAGASLKVATITVICIMVVLTSLKGQEAAKVLCKKCDKYCSSSIDGCTTSFCGSACDNTTSPGCTSCKEAYVSKCENLCVNSCLANCIHG
ncbi:unnamed protein product [Urochloa humidicola]